MVSARPVSCHAEAAILRPALSPGSAISATVLHRRLLAALLPCEPNPQAATREHRGWTEEDYEELRPRHFPISRLQTPIKAGVLPVPKPPGVGRPSDHGGNPSCVPI